MSHIRPADNPFRASCIEALPYQFVDGSWAMLWQRLQRLRGRGVIVGPHGSGKTTLLDALAQHLSAEKQSIIRIRADPSHATSLPSTLSLGKTWILLDGAETLPPFVILGWIWRCRAAAGLIATAHRPSIFLPTLWRTRTTPALTSQLARTLDPDCAVHQPEHCFALWQHCRGDLRQIWRQLFDRASQMPA